MRPADRVRISVCVAESPLRSNLKPQSASPIRRCFGGKSPLRSLFPRRSPRRLRPPISTAPRFRNASFTRLSPWETAPPPPFRADSPACGPWAILCAVCPPRPAFRPPHAPRGRPGCRGQPAQSIANEAPHPSRPSHAARQQVVLFTLPADLRPPDASWPLLRLRDLRGAFATANRIGSSSLGSLARAQSARGLGRMEKGYSVLGAAAAPALRHPALVRLKASGRGLADAARFWL